MKILANIKYYAYRMKVRKALKAADMECLKITLAEVKKEIESRNKRR